MSISLNTNTADTSAVYDLGVSGKNLFNCVVVRRSGEQTEADLRSQTKVNPIRFATVASLRSSGEACGQSHNRYLSQTSYMGEKWAVGDGWGGNAGKVSYGSVETCAGRNPCKRGRTEVRAAIVAKKLWSRWKSYGSGWKKLG